MPKYFGKWPGLNSRSTYYCSSSSTVFLPPKQQRSFSFLVGRAGVGYGPLLSEDPVIQLTITCPSDYVNRTTLQGELTIRGQNLFELLDTANVKLE